MKLFDRSPFTRAKNVHISMPKAALEAVFDECDRYDADETGGRILGTYEQRGGKLLITVSAIIEPGPRARRTATSFFQDGEHQERVFRQLEGLDASIEHLGNWHTHHVNGYPNLSGGDIQTYRRIVEHENHNTNFFYALLVVAKHHGQASLGRYAFKNYVFRRGDPKIYEVDQKAIKVVESPLLWPKKQDYLGSSTPQGAQLGRVYDRDMLREFFPDVAPYMSKQLGMYWRGSLDLIDGSRIEPVVLEGKNSDQLSYTVQIRKPPQILSDIAGRLAAQVFPSARVALIETERVCNRAIFELKHATQEQ